MSDHKTPQQPNQHEDKSGNKQPGQGSDPKQPAKQPAGDSDHKAPPPEPGHGE